MNLVYTGPSHEKIIVADGYTIGCVRGVAFEVPDALGKSLLEQDTFEVAKKSTADPAASTTPVKE